MKISAVNDCLAFDYKRKALVVSHNTCHLITASYVHSKVHNTVYVTGFGKRGLIHAYDFATLMSHNFVCDYTIILNFSPTLVE